MQSVSPVFSEAEVSFEKVIASNDIGLPIDVHTTDPESGETTVSPHFAVATRFRFSDEERAKIAAGADLIITELVFGKPFTPLNFQICNPDERPVF